VERIAGAGDAGQDGADLDAAYHRPIMPRRPHAGRGAPIALPGHRRWITMDGVPVPAGSHRPAQAATRAAGQRGAA